MSSEQPNGVSNGTSKTAFPLEKLSWTITKYASIPTFESDGPSAILPAGSPQNVQEARQKLIAASLELAQLAIGPSEFLPNLATGFQYISCVSWLCQYDIFHLVSQSNEISYAALATAARVPEQRLKSIVRMATTSTLFRESSDGKQLDYSATSALLARNDDVYAYGVYMCAESAPMAMHMAAAAQRWEPASMKASEAAYNDAFDTDLPFFDYISRDETKMAEFAVYMRNVRSSEGVNIKHLVASFAWQDIKYGGKLSTTCLPTQAAGRKAAEVLPADIASRLTFQSHDFTHPQPVQGADIYLLRMILHDWPDSEAAKILRHMVSAMDKVNSRLLIMDTVLPKPGCAAPEQRSSSAQDMKPRSSARRPALSYARYWLHWTMLQAFNSKERDLYDWKDVLASADPNLQLVNVVQYYGSAMSVLEVALGSTATAKD
ncbi:hypothetical protein MMC27_008824 [Xylographa pallens]|nr:hypothetical protein [Xylographa pallens]